MNRFTRSIRSPLILLALLATFGLAFAQSDDSVKVEVYDDSGAVVGYAELDDNPEYAIEVEILPGVDAFTVTFGDVTYEGTLRANGTWWIVDLDTLEALPTYKVEYDDDPSPRDEDELHGDDDDDLKDDEDDDLYDDDDDMHDEDDGSDHDDDDEDDDGDDDDHDDDDGDDDDEDEDEHDEDDD